MKKIGWLGAVMVRRLSPALRMGGLILLAACVLISSIPTFASATASASDAAQPDAAVTPEFLTPEDAVQHFIKALAANDFDMAMEACAVREQADGFDFSGSVDRLKTHIPMTMSAPSTSDLYRDLNTAAILGSIANQMKMLIYSFFVTDGLDGKLVTPADAAYAEAFAQAVDTQKLNNLKLLRIDPPMKSILESAKNIENFTRMARLYGAQEMTERIVLYELDGQTFLGGFGLYRYASGWKICRLNSILAGLPSFGTVTKVTVQAYLGML